MDIKCEKCGAIYEFPEDQIPPEGLMVKCEECGHVFRVEPPRPDEEEEMEFMVRKQDGSILRFKHLETLHEWILDGVVTKEDEISSTGDSWAPLGILPELEEYFAEYERFNRSPKRDGKRSTDTFPAEPPVARPQKAPKKSAPKEEDLVPDEDGEPEWEGGDLSTEGELEDGEPTLGQGTLSMDEEDRPYLSEQPPAGSGLMWWLLGIFLLVGGGAVGALFYLGILPSPLEPEPVVITEKEEAPAPKVDEAKALQDSWSRFKVGTEESFVEALGALQGCQSRACAVRRASIKAVWAFYLSEDAALFAKKWPKEMSEERKKRRLNFLRSKMARKVKEAAKELSEDDSGPEFEAVSALLDILNGDPKAWSRLSGVDSQEPMVLLLKGLGAYKTDHIKEADSILTRLVKEHQSLLPALFALGRVKEAEGDVVAAYEWYTRVCDSNPSHLRGCTLSQDLEPVAMQARKEGAKQPEAKGGKGRAQEKERNRSKENESADAFAVFDDYMAKAEEAYRANNKVRALKYYLKAAKADPSSPDAWNGAGYCNLDLGRYNEAVKYFRKALTVARNYSTAQYGLAEALYYSGRRRAALNAYKRFLQIASPDNRHIPHVRQRVAQLEEELGLAKPAGPEPASEAPAKEGQGAEGQQAGAEEGKKEPSAATTTSQPPSGTPEKPAAPSMGASPAQDMAAPKKAADQKPSSDSSGKKEPPKDKPKPSPQPQGEKPAQGAPQKKQPAPDKQTGTMAPPSMADDDGE